MEVAFKKDELESDRTVSWAIEKGFYLREPITGFVWTSVGEARLHFGDEASLINLKKIMYTYGLVSNIQMIIINPYLRKNYSFRASGTLIFIVQKSIIGCFIKFKLVFRGLQ